MPAHVAGVAQFLYKIFLRGQRAAQNLWTRQLSGLYAWEKGITFAVTRKFKGQFFYRKTPS
jgi:hypothetical protein